MKGWAHVGVSRFHFFTLSLSHSLWRHRIDPARMERMTTQQAADCQPAAAQRTVGVDRFGRIRRAGWVEAALPADERAQAELIDPDQCEQDAFHR